MKTQRCEAQRSDQSRQLLYFLGKETINLFRIYRRKGFELGGVNLCRSNKICLYSLLGPELPISGNKGTFFLPGIRRVPSHRNSFPAFGETKEVRMSLCLLFLKNFNSQ